MKKLNFLSKLNIKELIDPKNHFNFSLYLNNIRSTAIISITCFIIMILLSIINGISIISDNDSIINHYDFEGTQLLLYQIFFMIAPLLTISSFRFLSKRNASDYFHVLPIRRGCIFTSYIASIVTLLFLLTVSCTGAISLIITAGTSNVPIDYTYLWTVSLSTFVTSIFVTMAIAIACACSTNLFTNILLGLSIILVPRLLICLRIICINLLSDTWPMSTIERLFGNQNHLLFSTFVEGPDIHESGFFVWAPEAFTEPTAIVYTLIISVIYFFIARVLFVNRAVEKAGKRWPSKVFYIIFVACPGFILTYFPVLGCCLFIIEWNWSSLNVIFLVALVIIEIIGVIAVLIIYGITNYEEYWDNMNAWFSIGTYFLLQIIMVAFTLSTFYYEYNFSPDAKKIDYIISDIAFIEYSDNCYTEELADCKIKDDKIIELISKCLKNTVKYGDDYGKHDFVIGINTGLITRYRCIRMTPADYNELENLMIKNDDFLATFDSLPEFDDEYMYLDAGYGYSTLLRVYNTLREEVAAMEPEEWYNILHSRDSSFSFTLRYNDYIKDYSHDTKLYLTEKTPKALAGYLNYVSDYHTWKRITNLSTEWNKVSREYFFKNTSGTITVYDSSFEAERVLKGCWDYMYYNSSAPSSVDESRDIAFDKLISLFEYIGKNDYVQFSSIEIPEGYKLVMINFESTYTNGFTYYAYVPDDIIENLESKDITSK